MTKTLPGRRIPYFWDNYARKYRALLTSGQPAPAVLKEAGWRAGLWAANQIGWTLDDLLEPAWRDVRMEGPIFILGHQRSGTTLMHRLLIEDALERAVGMTTAQLLLPSVSIRKGIATLFASQKEAFDAWQDRRFGPLDHIHRVRFDLIEEDEFALWSIFASHTCATDSPRSICAEGLDPIRRVDAWPIGRQRESMAWYRACLLKTLHDAGHRRGIFVGKNPAFSKRIPLLKEEFPEAKFIYLVRNPLETIPSRLSLFQALWGFRFPGFEKLEPEHIEAIVADSYRIYLEAEEGLKELAEDRQVIVDYRSFVKDPADVTRQILAHFDLDEAPGFDAALERRLGRRKKGDKKHRYGLEDFGLSEAQLRQDLAPVFERYGF